MVHHRADARARHTGYGEALDHHVARALEVDAVLRGRVLRVDDGARLTVEGDRIARRPAGRQVEARVVAGPHDHEVAGADRVRRLLQRPPRLGGRAGPRSASTVESTRRPGDTCGRAPWHSTGAAATGTFPTSSRATASGASGTRSRLRRPSWPAKPSSSTGEAIRASR